MNASRVPEDLVPGVLGHEPPESVSRGRLDDAPDVSLGREHPSFGGLPEEKGPGERAVECDEIVRRREDRAATEEHVPGVLRDRDVAARIDVVADRGLRRRARAAHGRRVRHPGGPEYVLAHVRLVALARDTLEDRREDGEPCVGVLEPLARREHQRLVLVARERRRHRVRLSGLGDERVVVGERREP
jgi:hypothetical protein